jgi:hypothetical protein
LSGRHDRHARHHLTAAAAGSAEAGRLVDQISMGMLDWLTGEGDMDSDGMTAQDRQDLTGSTAC